MGLFKEVKCVRCGKKANMLTRIKLEDGQYICGKCLEKIPSVMSNELTGRSYDDYITLKIYMEKVNPMFKEKFRETHKFHGIHIDTTHDLFYLDSVYPTTYFHFKDLTDFNLEFVADEVKDGMFGTKVTGKIYMKIRVNYLFFFKDEVLAKDVKATAKIAGIMNKKVTYDNPKGMDDFLYHLKNAWHHALNEEYYRLSREIEELTNESDYSNVQVGVQSSEVQQALALFMIDDLNGITLSDLKTQRNRLIKTFHPDHGSSNDTGYAQKINNAYEILKKQIG